MEAMKTLYWKKNSALKFFIASKSNLILYNLKKSKCTFQRDNKKSTCWLKNGHK